MGFNLTTFIFECINFVVLVWLLERLVYRPLKQGIAKRQAALEAKEAKAESELADAASKAEAVAEERRELVQLKQRVLREAVERAEEQGAAILEQAKQEALAERTRMLRVIDAEREKAEAWVRDMALERTAELSAAVLEKLSGDAVQTALVDQLVREVRAQSATLELPSEGDGDVSVEVTTATAASDRELEVLQQKLEHVLERRVRLRAQQDQRLGAGVVVKLGDQVFDASIAGQLGLVLDGARAALEREARVG